MFLVAFPTMLVVALLLYIFIYPFFTEQHVDSRLSVQTNNFGFEVFDNSTNTEVRPISAWYAAARKPTSGGTLGVARMDFQPDVFFDDLAITLF